MEAVALTSLVAVVLIVDEAMTEEELEADRERERISVSEKESDDVVLMVADDDPENDWEIIEVALSLSDTENVSDEL